MSPCRLSLVASSFMTKPLGILGGTFDPVHHGHLRLALECMEAIDLAGVSFVPLHTPPHRGNVQASTGQRLQMLQLATENVAGLDVSDLEIRRGGTSYTIDTVRELRDKYGSRPLCLIMGMDALQGINTWKNWDLLPDHVHIIVTDRPGTETEITNAEVAAFYAARHTTQINDIHTLTAGKIYKTDIPLLAISATRIRSLFADGKHPDFLLPDAVISHIKAEKIYPEMK